MTKNVSTADLILMAVTDLCAQEQYATRETLEQVTGLERSIIDDRIKHLIDTGRVIRVERGIYAPAHQHPPTRVITKTILPDGSVSIEVGDTVLLLTPQENRYLGELMAGAGQQYASIELGKQATHIAADLHEKVKRLRREMTALKKMVPGFEG